MRKMIVATTALLALLALRASGLQAQARHQDLPRSLRSIAGVTLNKDSAASIRATLGDTRERPVGEGHDAYATWCYVGSEGTPTPVLELMSLVGEMGTPERSLNVIRLRADAPAGEREGCAPLPSSASLSMPYGLRLGVTRSKVRTILGPTTRESGDSLIYDFEAKEDMKPGSAAYQEWNTPERRKSCFQGGAPYVSVEAQAIVILRDERAVEIRLERYDQATC